MKPLILVKQSLVGGGSDDLDGIDPLDVYGNSSNVKLIKNSLCFTIDETNTKTYIHKAVKTINNHITSSPRLVVPTTNSQDWIWKLITILDDSPKSLPEYAIKELNTYITPAGYKKIGQENPIVELMDDTDMDETVTNPFLGFYGDWIYLIGSNWMQSVYASKFNTKTKEFDTTVPNNVAMGSPAKCQVGNILYFFDSSNAVTRTLDLYAETWGTVNTLPGPARIQTIGGVLNGKCYIANGYTTQYENYFYEYDPVGDSFTQNTDTPNTKIKGLAPFGSKLYGITTDHPSKIYAYDPVGNSWDSTLPDCAYNLEPDIGYGWLAGWGVFAYYDNICAIFDPVTELWLYDNPWGLYLSWDAAGYSSENGEAFYTYPYIGQQYLYKLDSQPNITVIKE